MMPLIPAYVVIDNCLRVQLHCFSPVCFALFHFIFLSIYFLSFPLSPSTVAINSIELKRAFQSTLKKVYELFDDKIPFSSLVWLLVNCFCGKFNVPIRALSLSLSHACTHK